jgi:hypothetical protein
MSYVPRTIFTVCFLFIFLSCNSDVDDKITISFEDMLVPGASVVYIRSGCVLEGKHYDGIYSYMQRSFNFSLMNDCTNVQGSNINLDNCSGSLTATCDNVIVSCELVDDNGSCLCSNDHGDTEAERSSKDKISNGLKTLLDKVNSAREYIFVGSNVCKEDMEDPYTSYVCSCSLL